MYATNVIYSRIIGLQASGRDYLKNELAPVPMAMFDNSDDMSRPVRRGGSLGANDPPPPERWMRFFFFFLICFVGTPLDREIILLLL